MNIGARIKALREEKRMTQQQLANKVGMERTSITNIEAGMNTTVGRLGLIAEALNTSLGDLVGNRSPIVETRIINDTGEPLPPNPLEDWSYGD